MSESKVSRRGWLGGMGASAAAGLLGGGAAGTGTEAQAASVSPGRIEAEVLVIGAGYAGLACTRALQQAGRDVVLLEARSRPGGRCLNQAMPAPFQRYTLEAGAAYLAPQQTRMRELAAELGIGIFPTYNTGKLVSYLNGRRGTYSGVVPTANLVAAAELGLALLNLDALAAKLDAEAPWAHPKAAEWDSQTFQNWMDKNLLSGDAKDMMRLAVLSLLSCEPREVSLLFVLLYARAAGSLTTLLSTEGGGQQDRVVGGSQRIALGMALQVQGRLLYNMPVHRLSQTAQGVVVSGDGFEALAQRVVVAMSPGMAGRMRYDGALDGAMQQRLQLMQRMPMGAIWKVHCVYDRPFWRDDGLNGQVTSDQGLTKVTFDSTPPEAGAPGVLMGFIDGQDALDACTMAPAERKQKVIESLVAYFGPKAAQPLAYAEQNWQAEDHSAGGPTAYTGPGVLTALGPALRAPCGRVHWAGAETATVWLGYMEGAVRSGERAAREVLARL